MEPSANNNIGLRMAGVTLASLLASLSSNPHDFEGWLYGDIVQRTQNTLQDSPVKQPLSTTQYVMKSYLSLGAPGVMYNQCGEINGQAYYDASRVAKSQGLQLLGWFMARKNSALRPSLREQAVIRSLSQHLSIPPIFALFTQSRQVGNDTNVLNCDYRMFLGQTRDSSNPNYSLVDHVVDNLLSSSHSEYHEFEAVWSESFNLFQDYSSSFIPAPSQVTVALENAHKQTMEGLKALAHKIFITSVECRAAELDIRELQRELNQLSGEPETMEF